MLYQWITRIRPQRPERHCVQSKGLLEQTACACNRNGESADVKDVGYWKAPQSYLYDISETCVCVCERGGGGGMTT